MALLIENENDRVVRRADFIDNQWESTHSIIGEISVIIFEVGEVPN